MQAPATSFSDDRFVLDPIAALHRSKIPFSWLDTSPSTLIPIQSGSLFVAGIPTLENVLRERAEPTVLAVRLISDGGLYVIERVKRGIYALSRLGPWVEEGDIFVAVKGWTDGASDDEEQKTARCQSPSIVDGVEWWQAARVEDPIVDVGVGNRKVDACVTFLDHEAHGDNVSPVDPGESQTAPVVPRFQAMESYSGFDTHMPTATQDTQELGNSMVSGYAGGEGELNTQIDDLKPPQEFLDGLRDQYLQALYISKVSMLQP